MADPGFTIDDLQIKISADATQAASSLKALAKTLRETASDCSKTAQSFQDIAKGAQAMSDVTEEASDNTEKLDEAAKKTHRSLADLVRGLVNVGKSALSAVKGGISQYFDMIKRVATYRLIRTAIKLITQAFKEGIQNLVEWDRTIANTSRAAKTMDELKATALQLKNTLGAMAMPIIQVLQPALNLLARGLMFVANVINQCIRYIQGYTTYMKAAYKETKSTTGAAKELQRVLFGFDELNVLPSQGGTTGAVNALKDAFKETDIEIPGLPQMAKSFWQQIKGMGEGISWFFEDPDGAWQEAWKTFKQDMNDAWETFKETTIQPIGNFFSVTLPNWFRGIWRKVSGWFSNQWKQAKDDWAKDMAWISGIFSGLWDGICNGASAAWEWVQTHFINPIKEYGGALWETIKRVVEFITNPSTWNAGGFHQMCEDIKGYWADAMNALDKKTNENKEHTVSYWAVLKDEAQETAKGIGSEFEKNTYKIRFDATLDSSGLNKKLSNVYYSMQAGLDTTPLILGTQLGLASQGYAGWGRSRLQALEIPNYTKGFAEGGSPDTGTLFYAGEAGAEVVANTSHGTGVMNVSQMQEAVANGNLEVVNAVYAMANMVSQAINGKNFDVYLDSAKVGHSVTQYQYNQARRGVTQGAY